MTIYMGGDERQFSAEVVGDYIHLKTWGKLAEHNLEAPAVAALALAKERGVNKLLDDIRDIDTTAVSIAIQARGVGVLWKLRTFDKVAIVLRGNRIRSLFFATINTLHLDSDAKFRGFDDEQQAIAWLAEK